MNKDTNVVVSDDEVITKPIMPDHEVELRSNMKIFTHHNKKYKSIIKAHKDGDLTKQDVDDWVGSLRYQVEDILYQVGELSLCVRELKEPLREYYLKNFKPAIADTMFEKEYDEAELPYDILKNKCYQLMGKMIGEEL